MTDDKLLKGLADAARRARLGEPDMDWDALAAGTLSEEEREALLATDEDGELAALFEPLGDDFVDGVLGNVLGIVDGGAGVATLDGVVQDPVEPGTSSPEEPLPKPANRPFWMLWAAPLIALAAAALLFFAMPMNGADLPDYQWEVSGGDQMVRGSNTVVEARRRLAPGSALEITARPTDRADGPLAATAFVRQADGSLRASAVPVQVAPSGAVRWVGQAGQDVLLSGASEVVLVIHPAGTNASRVAAAADDGSWPRRVVPVAIGPAQ